MKKLLPLFVFVLLAFAGCHPQPAVYEYSNDPQTVMDNCEKFVNYTFDKSKRYNEEDWNATIVEFVHMCKNYKEYEFQLPVSDRERFQAGVVKFMKAVDANGIDSMAYDVKAKYAEVFNNPKEYRN